VGGIGVWEYGEEGRRSSYINPAGEEKDVAGRKLREERGKRKEDREVGR